MVEEKGSHGRGRGHDNDEEEGASSNGKGRGHGVTGKGHHGMLGEKDPMVWQRKRAS